MNKSFKILVLTLFLLFVFLFNLACAYAYGNPLLEVIPEKVIAVLELKDTDLMKNISEIKLPEFLKKEEYEKQKVDYKVTREEIKEELGFDILDPIFLENIFSNGVVLSWLGVSVGGVPEVLIAISPSDSHTFLKFIGAIESKFDLKEKVSTFKGIDLVSIDLPEDAGLEPLKTISYAFLGDIIVIGGNLSPVKKAIGVFKGEANPILKNPEYKELKVKTNEMLKSSSFFFCLFSEKLRQVLDELADLIEKEEVVKTLRDSRDSLEGMGPLSVAGVSLEKQFKAYMITKASAEYLDMFKDLDLSNLRSLSMFPKNTFFYLGGLVPLTWEEMKNDFLSESSRADLEQNLKQAQIKMGIDIEESIFSCLATEFSLGLFDTSAIFPKVGLITGYISEEKITQDLYPALQMFAPMLGGELSDKEYEGVNYKSIENPMLPLGYGIVGDRFVLSSSTVNIIDAQKGDVATIDKLEAIKYMLSHPNVISLLYVDMNSVTEVVSRFMQMAEEGREVEVEVEVEEREEEEAILRETIMESLSSIKNILAWGGIEEDYFYTWLEVNYN
ncbi:MAG: DUF3352 domain-containing protein [Candidatus Atribacteria bacterium]|nr:DUF3352 domain-containing protein [Candidatus Atribacteria bacterium]MCK4309003.1 DUF3352 domain-containing protein [Candidatus Atribacteria bacterium]